MKRVAVFDQFFSEEKGRTRQRATKTTLENVYVIFGLWNRIDSESIFFRLSELLTRLEFHNSSQPFKFNLYVFKTLYSKE